MLDEMKDLSTQLSALDTVPALEVSHLLDAAVAQWRPDPVLIKIAIKMLA